MLKVTGYPTGYGWMGWVESLKRWMLFATRAEYLEYIEDE